MAYRQPDEERLRDYARPTFDHMKATGATDIGQGATTILNRLDRATVTLNQFPSVYEAAHFGYRQVLRGMFRDDTTPSTVPETPEQLELFKKYPHLNRWYPRAHIKGKAMGYVLVHKMEENDWRWNLAAMKKNHAGLGAQITDLEKMGKIERGFTLEEPPEAEANHA